MSYESSTNGDTLQFGRFIISPEQIFYRSPPGLSAAIVNLRPIVPGHVLVMSTRVVPHLAQLSEEEYADLWSTVRTVQNMLEKRYFGDNDGVGQEAAAAAFNVAVQDGRNAGQSVPHVHVHILPRAAGDFERNDDVYDELEAWAPRPRPWAEDVSDDAEKQQRLQVLADEDRRDRTMEEMDAEADEYRRLISS